MNISEMCCPFVLQCYDIASLVDDWLRVGSATIRGQTGKSGPGFASNALSSNSQDRKVVAYTKKALFILSRMSR